MVKRRSLSSWAFFLLGIFTIIALVAGPPIAAYAVAAPSTTTTSCGISCSPSPSGAVVEQQQEDDIISSGEHHHHNNNLDKFYIHGWRWHTLSLGRDARRLAQLATHYHHHTFALLQKKQQEQEEEGVTTTNVFADLQKATDHTVNFNMKGLHQIEQEVFFPWVRRVVVESILLSMKNNNNKNEKSAVATTTQQQQQQQRRLVATMDRLEQYQRRLHELGRALVSNGRTDGRMAICRCCWFVVVSIGEIIIFFNCFIDVRRRSLTGDPVDLAIGRFFIIITIITSTTRTHHHRSSDCNKNTCVFVHHDRTRDRNG